jgi:hypothetical protein
VSSSSKISGIEDEDENEDEEDRGHRDGTGDVRYSTKVQ